MIKFTMGITSHIRIAFLALIMASFTFADVIYVNMSADGSGNNGTSWADAYLSLQDGLDEATNEDEVWVANGIYWPSAENGGTGARFNTFKLKNRVKLYGGFAGGESELSERDWKINETILSGEYQTTTDDSDNCYHVVTSSGTNATAVLDGFIIKAGNANSLLHPESKGGGMLNIGGSPTISNCKFIENKAAGHRGGGIYNMNYSYPLIINCVFENNTSGEGGAIGNENYSNPVIENCIFSNNNAVSTRWSGGIGGAIVSINKCKPQITNCIFTGNISNDDAGAIQSRTSCTTTLTNCIFSGNSCNDKAGGVYDRSSSISKITNCSFYGNTSGYGGAVYSWGTSKTTISNSILWGNSATNGNEIGCGEGSFVSVSYSDVAGGQAGVFNETSTLNWTNNIEAAPLFADPDGIDNIIGNDNDNLRIMAGSPCIDAGNNNAISVSIDLDNYPRKFDDIATNDTGTGSAPIVDMGAYEYRSAIALGKGFSYQGRLDYQGNAANGSYDFKFKLYDTAAHGGEIGSEQDLPATIVRGGIFTVSLDFGDSSEIFNGDERWLEIAVRQSGGGEYTILSPRQPIRGVPYAQYAANANTAENNEPTGELETGKDILVKVEIAGLVGPYNGEFWFYELEEMDSETEVIEFQDGDDPILRKRPGRTKVSNITLRRHVSNEMSLYEWTRQITNGILARRDMTIKVLGSDGEQLAAYNYYGTWPCELSYQTNKEDNTIDEVVELTAEEMTASEPLPGLWPWQPGQIPIIKLPVKVEIAGLQTILRLDDNIDFGYNIDVIEYQDGDDPIIRKRPGRTKITDLNIAWDGPINNELYLWYRSIIAGNYERRDMSLIMQDDNIQEILRLNGFGCWPYKCSYLFDKNKNALTNKVEMAVEEMQVIPTLNK